MTWTYDERKRFHEPLPKWLNVWLAGEYADSVEQNEAGAGRKAIDTARAWLRGAATQEDCKRGARAAWATARAGWTAWAAARAAWAAAAADAADAADAAAAAAWDAAYAAAYAAGCAADAAGCAADAARAWAAARADAARAGADAAWDAAYAAAYAAGCAADAALDAHLDRLKEFTHRVVDILSQFDLSDPDVQGVALDFLDEQQLTIGVEKIRRLSPR